MNTYTERICKLEQEVAQLRKLVSELQASEHERKYGTRDAVAYSADWWPNIGDCKPHPYKMGD